MMGRGRQSQDSDLFLPGETWDPSKANQGPFQSFHLVLEKVSVPGVMDQEADEVGEWSPCS